MERVYAAIIIILFSPSSFLQLIYCRRHRRRLLAGWISQETSPLPHSAAVSQSSLPDPPPTKEHDSNFPPKTQIPGRFTSVQETGRSSRSAHWPRNGGGTERAPPPNANGGERRRRENGEATRSNIRNRMLPDRLVFLAVDRYSFKTETPKTNN